MPAPHKMSTLPESKVLLSVICPACEIVKDIEVSNEQYSRYLADEQCIQDYMSDVSSADRELLLGGICGDCFDAMVLLWESCENDYPEEEEVFEDA